MSILFTRKGNIFLYNCRPTKYLREKILDQRNIREKKFWTHEIPTKARDRTKTTRPTIARDPRNLAHSEKTRKQTYCKNTGESLD